MSTLKKQILFVDDEQPVLDSLRRMLHSQEDVWEMTYVNRPETAWEQLLAGTFDLVVSDVKMPGMSGLQLLTRIQQTASTRDIPVVMLTGMSDRALKREALDLGAADLLNKPVEVEDLTARLRSILRLKSSQDELRAYNQFLERKVQDRTVELFHSRLDIVWRLGEAVEHAHEESGNHVIRVGCFSRAVAEALGLDRHFVETLFLAAPLHDIGKIGIPGAILRKRGALSPAEQAVMEQHCRIGERVLRENSKIRAALSHWRDIGSQFHGEADDNPLLDMAASIALTHHEKWDGTGYPQELRSEKIPLESRIVAISDAFDALTSRCSYGDPYPEDDGLEILRNEEGSHFDPDVYTAFVTALPEIRSIRQRFADDKEILQAPKHMRDEKQLI